MKSILVAGATGYLGRFLVAEFGRRGWHVRALVRDREKAAGLTDDLFEGRATNPATLVGLMDGIDAVVSALGITRQKDKLGYRDVDFQANVNLLDAALAAEVHQFGYVHVLGAERALDSALVRAKQDFVDRLRAAPIANTVIAPSGYFSDMEAFLDMAKSGRVLLIGDGKARLNPIHGADLAAVCAEAIERGSDHVDVGGPEVLSHDRIAELAFGALGRTPRILHLPAGLARGSLACLKIVAGEPTWGPFEFFLAAMRADIIGPCYGERRLAEHFAAQSPRGSA